MRVVIDGLPIRGGSLALVVQQLLRGWRELEAGDELHVLLGPDAQIEPEPGVDLHRVEVGTGGKAGRFWHQNMAIRKHCAELNADVMLGSLPATAVVPLPCPRAVIAYDLRHELRRHQFSRRFRLLRGLSYGAGFRQADGVACISAGTRDDLLASRSWLDPDRVRVALLGADHVLAWARPEKPQAPYALAFGQYGNKNVRLLLEAWQLLAERRTPLPLKIVGFRPRRLPEAQAIVDSYGLGDTVELSGWLPDRDFQTHFTGAAMVVFPSDFEGFGLPAIEAMRLGIPLVITPERTLRAITGGLVTTAAGWSAAAIADAVERALPLIGQPADQSVTTWAEAFTWRRTANDVRSLLLDLTRDDNRRQRRWRLPSARALAATTRRSR